MSYLGFETRVRQGAADFIGNHYRAMPSPGTAERDGQVALSFAYIVRQEIDQQVCNTTHKFRSLRERADVSCYTGVFSGQVLKSRNVVGVGKKPDVKHQVAIRRY